MDSRLVTCVGVVTWSELDFCRLSALLLLLMLHKQMLETALGLEVYLQIRWRPAVHELWVYNLMCWKRAGYTDVGLKMRYLSSSRI